MVGHCQRPSKGSDMPSTTTGGVEGSEQVMSESESQRNWSEVPEDSVIESELVEELSEKLSLDSAPGEQCEDPPAEHPYLVVVAERETGLSIVPEPVIVEEEQPECNAWTGAGYGHAIAHDIPVDVTHEQVVYKKVKQYVQRPVERVVHVPKILKQEKVIFQKVVTDEVIEVPKPYTVTKELFVPNFIDSEKYCVMSSYNTARVVQPTHPISVGDEMPSKFEKEVICTITEPEVRFVDVHVPKIVDDCIIVREGIRRLHRLDCVSQEQWNSMVLKLNPDLVKVGKIDNLPLYKNEHGQVIAFKPEHQVGVPL